MSRLTSLGMNSNLALNKGANYSSIFYFTETISSWPANTVYSLYDRAVAKGYRGEQIVANITINSGVVIHGFTFFSLKYTNTRFVETFLINGVNSSFTITNNGTIYGYGGTGRNGTSVVGWDSGTGANTPSIPLDYAVPGVFGATGVLKTFSNSSGGNAIDIGVVVNNTAGGNRTPVQITINGSGYIYGGGGGGGGGSHAIAYVKEPGIVEPGFESQAGGGGGGGRGSPVGISFGVGQVTRGLGGAGGTNSVIGLSFYNRGATGAAGSVSSAGSGGAGGLGPSNNLISGSAGAGGAGGSFGSVGSAGAIGVNGSNITNVTINPATITWYTTGGPGGFAVMVWGKEVNFVTQVNVSYGGSIVSNSLGGFGITAENSPGATGVILGPSGSTGVIVGATSGIIAISTR